MKYTGQYIWPPRPGGAIAPGSDYFKRLEADPSWIAQVKMNGSNTQMVLIDNEPEFFNRHNAASRYEPTKEQIEFFKTLEAHAPIVLNLECMDGKVTTLKNQLYVYDILVYKGEWLIGTTVEYRQNLLREIFPNQVSTLMKFAKEIGPQVLLAENFEAGWQELFDLYATSPGFEGVVIKNRIGKLDAGWQEKNNHGWAIRSRIRDK